MVFGLVHLSGDPVLLMVSSDAPPDVVGVLFFAYAMFAAVPPRRRCSDSTRNDTLITCVISGRMCSLKRPGKTMIVSKATDPVTAMRPMGEAGYGHRRPCRPVARMAR